MKSISLLTIAGTRPRVESVLPDTSEGIGLDLVDGCGVAINNLYYVYFLSFLLQGLLHSLLLPLRHS